MEEKNEIMTNLGEIITLIGKLKSCDGKNLKTINKKVNNLHSYLKKKKKKTIKKSRKSRFISSDIMSEPEDVPSEPTPVYESGSEASVGMSPGPDADIPSDEGNNPYGAQDYLDDHNLSDNSSSLTSSYYESN